MGEARIIRHSVAALVAAVALVTAACGARLTDEQRLAGIGGLAGPAGGATAGPGGVTGPGGISPTTAGSINPTTGATTGPGGPPAGGAFTGDNGGATDTGVTATKLTIATIADVRGIQTGLFRGAHQAMQALVAKVNAEGGIDGRQLELLLLDSQTNVGATRNAVLEACEKAFALVGSMSAFDNGGGEAVDDCSGGRGIPDITAITTSLARIQAENTFPAYPNRPDLFIAGSGRTIKERFPDAVGASSQLWLNTSTTRINAESKREAYKSLGYEFTYTAETSAAEPNYAPFVQKMKDNNIQFVTMLANWQSIATFLDAAKKQNFKPQVFEWDSVAYSPAFLDETKGSAEGNYVYLNTAMFEEASQYPEMLEYMAWLGRVAPGEKPDYFGLYAWSAGRLFVEMAKNAGPKLKRENLVAELKKVTSWDGLGLHAAHNIARKRASNCTMYVKIQNNAFVRYFPSKGYRCDTPLFPVPGY